MYKHINYYYYYSEVWQSHRYSDVLSHMFAHQVGQFMRVLCNGRDFDCPAPVVIVECLPVGQGLYIQFRQFGIVVNHRIFGRLARTLGHVLGHHEKLEETVLFIAAVLVRSLFWKNKKKYIYKFNLICLGTKIYLCYLLRYDCSGLWVFVIKKFLGILCGFLKDFIVYSFIYQNFCKLGVIIKFIGFNGLFYSFDLNRKKLANLPIPNSISINYYAFW